MLNTRNKVKLITNESAVQGSKDVLMYTGIFYLLTFLVSISLPNRKIDKKGGMMLAAH